MQITSHFTGCSALARPVLVFLEIGEADMILEIPAFHVQLIPHVSTLLMCPNWLVAALWRSHGVKFQIVIVCSGYTCGSQKPVSNDWVGKFGNFFAKIPRALCSSSKAFYVEISLRWQH